MENKISGIYRLISPSGKCYIGQSTNISQRFRQHRRDKRYKHPKLFQAIKKYGFDNFSQEIVERCPLHELDSKEKFWISHFDSVNNGYNCDYGGQQSKIFSKEHRERLRQAFLGVYNGNQNIEFFIDDVHYRSIGDASRQLGIPSKTIHNRLNSRNEKFSNYRYKDISLIPKRKNLEYKTKPFRIKNRIYNSLRTASEEIGIPQTTLRRHLKAGKIEDGAYL